MKELKSLKEHLETVHKLYSTYDDIFLLIDMAYEENDSSMIKEIQREIKAFEKTFEELRIQTLLSGEYDSCKAIFTMHAGAGGTDSCDWAEMMYRMYSRWVERKGFTMKVLDFVPGDITGTKGIENREGNVIIKDATINYQMLQTLTDITDNEINSIIEKSNSKLNSSISSAIP